MWYLETVTTPSLLRGSARDFPNATRATTRLRVAARAEAGNFSLVAVYVRHCGADVSIAYVGTPSECPSRVVDDLPADSLL